MKEVRLWWSGRHRGNSNHRGSGRRGVDETSQIWLCGCLYVAQIRNPIGLDFQAPKTKLVFNEGLSEKRITLQGCESESTLTLAQPDCRPPHKVQVLVLQASTLPSCSPQFFGFEPPYGDVSTSYLLNFRVLTSPTTCLFWSLFRMLEIFLKCLLI